MTRPNLIPLRIVPTHIAPSEAHDRAVVEIYRPFFTAGILAVLTAGCLLGAIALFGISKAGSYTASAWTPHILAHANSQLFGWVGFFVMGFALQQHPPQVRYVRLFHRVAATSLILMAIGIGIRFAAEPMVAVQPNLGVLLGMIACALQIVAVSLFLFNTYYPRYRSGQPLEWPSLFVFASLFFLMVVSVAEPFAFWGSHQADRLQSVIFVAEWFSPLREIQFLGFVAMMIFGVSLVKLPSCFGAPPASREYGLLGFAWWILGLGLRVGGWIWSFEQGLTASVNPVYQASSICLVLGAAHVAYACGVFGRLEGALRSHKFIRSAYAWLMISGLLMLLEPWHLRAIGQPFSHAYIGGIRHAVTVGFISQMILGVGSHVAARMNDLEDRVLPNLWLVFWLLNVGNAGRVLCEIATDYNPQAFGPMGFTGFIELTALVLWAGGMLKMMYPSWAVRFQTNRNLGRGVHNAK